MNYCVFLRSASRSVDDALYSAHLSTPGSNGKARKSSKGSVFGSLERMINMLTPKKQRGSTCEGPRKVKVSSSGELKCLLCFTRTSFYEKNVVCLCLVYSFVREYQHK